MSDQSLGLSLSSSQKMTANMMATPHMQRNLALLMAPIQQLQHEIFVELENNPALEIKEQENDSLDRIQANKNKGEVFKKRFEFVEQLLVVPETLSEHLIWQFRMEDISETYFEIGKTIIENLDENGFFIEDPYMLCMQLLKAHEKEVSEVLEIIQELDPVGCGTAGVPESLQAQLRMLDIDEDHRNLLRECISRLVQGLGSQKEGEEVKKEITTFLAEKNLQEYMHLLVPYPGRAYAYNHTDREIYVVPDANISVVNNELLVKINNDITPELVISPSIMAMQKIDDKEANTLATSLIQSAEAFIKGLEYRDSTLEKVILYIVQYQRDYFLGEKNFLLPFTGKALAKALDLNESTISRVIQKKYIQTPRGLFELKYFFSQRLGNQEASQHRIQTEIMIVIEALKKNGEKVSDRIISEKLGEKGLKVARRTVSKYRNFLEG